MRTEIALRQESLMPLPSRPNKVMLLTAGRMCYVGLLGRPTVREFGAITVYVSLRNPFRIQLGNGEWETAGARVIGPGTPHRIASSDRFIGMLMIEPETVDVAGLPGFLQGGHAQDGADAWVLARSVLHALMQGRMAAGDLRERFDLFFYGADLPSRRMDPRLTPVIRAIQDRPQGSFKADVLAAQVNLSVSRFLHLFREEVGTSFRQFRAWKRVRGFLAYVNTELNLTDIAMETGYPSSSHFSYTVRRYWGLAPRDIIAGSRHLAVIHDGGHPQAGRQ